MPTAALSPAALALFRLHVERRGHIHVDDSNRETYRELARVGLMRAGSTFRDGGESTYRLTQEGFDRKAELCGCAKESADSMHCEGRETRSARSSTCAGVLLSVRSRINLGAQKSPSSASSINRASNSSTIDRPSSVH
jgi:hypothetical protein